ncbi:hypothetical protein F4861DRAFT_327582 [Xylaria intraflava]|nr:hypothetical protein F4861DRAFT_327582 [Xylaria intraflava]
MGMAMGMAMAMAMGMAGHGSWAWPWGYGLWAGVGIPPHRIRSGVPDTACENETSRLRLVHPMNMPCQRGGNSIAIPIPGELRKTGRYNVVQYSTAHDTTRVVVVSHFSSSIPWKPLV